MKKIIFSTLFVFLCFINTVHAEVSSLNIVGDSHHPPYGYIDDKGIYKGFSVDIANALSVELGLDISLEPMKWDLAVEKLQSGEVDAVHSMIYSESREDRFDFSEIIVESKHAIFVKSDNYFIKELQDLSGVKVAIQSEDIAYERTSSVPGVQILEFESQSEAMKSLLNGEVDAFVGDRLTGLYFVQKYKYFEDVKVLEIDMNTSSYAFALAKDDNETLKLINEGIKELKKNGTYQKIYMKWFGEEIVDINKLKNTLHLTVFVLISTVVFVIFMAKLNKILKREVAKRTEEIVISKLKLAKEDRLKGKIIENVEAGIVAFNSSGVITNINEFAKNALEIDIEIGDSFRDIPILSDIDFSSLKQNVLEKPVEKEITFRAGSDIEKTLVYKLLPISDKSSFDGLLFCIFDLTKERSLNRLIAHSDKMQSLGVLSAGIAHEIRNPLTSIKMFVDLVPLKGSDQSFLEKFTSIVPSELNRLNELTSVLLDYSRPSRSKPLEIEFQEMIESVLLLVRPYFKKRQISITKKYHKIHFWADPSQFKQILLNILLNSVDAIEEQGEIIISASESSNRIYIKVEDNGSGIDEKVIPKIFDPFYTSKKHGYGIGLSITKNLVGENNGTIEVNSKKNRGTVVTLSFSKQSGGN